MKRLILLGLCLSAALTLSGQDRLYSTRTLEILRSQYKQLILNTVFDSNPWMYAGFIDDIYITNNKGIYIDRSSKSVICTKFDLDLDEDGVWSIKDKSRTALKVGERNAKCLSELINLAVSTSSLQDRSSVIDGSECYFIYDDGVAACISPEEPSLQYDLVEIFRAVCSACEEKDESAVDSLYNKAAALTAKYKKLLHYDFFASSDCLTIGSSEGYVYVNADFDTKISQDKLPEYKDVMEKIARYLVENSDEYVHRFIEVRSNLNKDIYKAPWFVDVVVGIDDFTTEKMIPLLRKILCTKDTSVQERTFPNEDRERALKSKYKDIYSTSRYLFGDIDRYVDVSASFDTKISQEQLPVYKDVMEKIARYILENYEQRASCDIDVRTGLEKDFYRTSDLWDIVVDAEDFTSERMLQIIGDILSGMK